MSLQVWVNGFEITSSPTHRINFRETEGLFDPVALAEPGSVETFEGSYRVRQTTVDYGVREISISGILYTNSVSYADKLRAIDWLQSIYAPRPSRVLVGSLELSVDFGRIQVTNDELKRLNPIVRYTITGTAIPATYASSVGAGLGFSQGLAVDSSAPNEAATTVTWPASSATSNTFTVLGDAPCAAVVTIKGAASTTYYLATSATGRRVPVTTDANGMGRIDERSGFWLVPGSRTITAYSAASGTTTLTTITAMSLFGTKWQYTGNQAAGNVTRFDLGPVLNVARTAASGLTATSNITNGYVFNGNTNPAASGTDGLVLAATPDVPRIGRIWENRRNLLVRSTDLHNSTSWTQGGSVSVTSSVSLEPFSYSISSSIATLTDATAASVSNIQQTLGALGTVTYVSSVYVLKDSVTSRQIGMQISTSTQFAVLLLNTSTGVAQKSTDSTLTSATVNAVIDAGLWWRISMSWTGDSSSNLVRLQPAAAAGGATATSSSATGSATFACPQIEIGSTSTAYQATTATAIATDHPNYPAGLILEGQAQNLCLYSEDQSNAAWVKGSGGVTSNAAVAPDGATTADRLLFSSPIDASTYQILTGLSASSLSYTLSAWVKAVTGTVDVLMQVQTVSAGVPTGTDVFTDVTTTVGTNWTRITQTGTSANTSLALLLSAGASFDVWGIQFELGTSATSYMPTTTVVTTRLSDVGGIVNPHNLLYYSEPVSQATIGTATVSNLWMRTNWTTSTTPVAGPLAGIFDACTVTTTATSTDNIRQAITPPGTVGGKVYTFSVWLRQNAPTSTTVTLVVLDVENQAGTSRATVNCRLDSTWRRYSLTVTMNAADTGLIAKIRGANAAGTIEVHGAQLVEGYAPGRYVRTTDTQVLNTTAIDASWSQNGYIEATIAWPSIPSGISANVYILGDSIGYASSATSIQPGTIIATINGTTIRFGRYDASATVRNAQYSSATDIALLSAKMRYEWTNYTLAGVRYMLLRIYTNGVLQNEVNFAGVAGTSWPAIDVSRLMRFSRSGGSDQATISNMTLGTPQFPQGAVPAGI